MKPRIPVTELAAQGRLTAGPLASPGAGSRRKGVVPFGMGSPRDGLVYVPQSYDPARPAPLLVLFHGATGSAEQTLKWSQETAEEAGVILLAPESADQSWDVLNEGFGPDVAFLDAALATAFDRYAVNPSRIGIGGFSDGASYALSLGLTNGDLFGHVLAFSPGFLAPGQLHGKPRVFISHGTQDQVLPITTTSRMMAPSMKRAGYAVEYLEFEGPHAIPLWIVQKGLAWYTQVAADPA